MEKFLDNVSRLEPVLRLITLGLALLVGYQIIRTAFPNDPLRGVTVPAAPHLNTDSNSRSNTGAPATAATPPASAPDRPANVPGPVQARIDRITQSEILGPVQRPLPMALLGIGGSNALLRAPNGQSGLMKVGDQMGGIKLLRIGTNRVLIELEGRTNELTIFSGFGGSTLLQNERQK